MTTANNILKSRELIQEAIMCLYDRSKERKLQDHQTIIMVMDNLVDMLDDAIADIEDAK